MLFSIVIGICRQIIIRYASSVISKKSCRISLGPCMLIILLPNGTFSSNTDSRKHIETLDDVF